MNKDYDGFMNTLNKINQIQQNEEGPGTRNFNNNNKNYNFVKKPGAKNHSYQLVNDKCITQVSQASNQETFSPNPRINDYRQKLSSFNKTTLGNFPGQEEERRNNKSSMFMQSNSLGKRQSNGNINEQISMNNK